jgi:hypothetical protein
MLQLLPALAQRPGLVPAWLRNSSTTSAEVRVAFLVSLEALLDRSHPHADPNSSLIYGCFAKLKSESESTSTSTSTGEGKVETGDIEASITYLVKILLAPFPAEQLAAWRVVQSKLYILLDSTVLLQWEWGVKAAVQGEYLFKCLVSRMPTTKEICELKFDIVKGVLQDGSLRSFIPPAILLQLQTYYAGGVFGEKAQLLQNPEYATKNQ